MLYIQTYHAKQAGRFKTIAIVAQNFMQIRKSQLQLTKLNKRNELCVCAVGVSQKL